MRLTQFHWLSALILFALLSGIVVHLFLSTDAVPEQARTMVQLSVKQPANTQLVTHASAPANQQEMVALMVKLAELQSQVLRLNALGDHLASEAKIPVKEFDFDQPPPSGGPVEQMRLSTDESFAVLMTKTTELADQLNHEESQLKVLESLTLGHHIQTNSYLSGKPIRHGWLSSFFGIRNDPFNGMPAMHKGMDFAGKENADVLATASGIVSWAGERYGYGKLVEINHGGGLKTRYGHNNTLLVKVGDVVNKGQVIAKMGSTGRSTGPHVHYEVLRNDRQINPMKFVYRKAAQ